MHNKVNEPVLLMGGFVNYELQITNYELQNESGRLKIDSPILDPNLGFCTFQL